MFVIKNLDTVGYSPDNVNNQKPIFHRDVILKARWTYSPDDTIEGYWGSIKNAQESLIKTMTELHRILDNKGIPLSLVVFPWPQQLEKDVVDSKHAVMWKEFCETKCANFINLFPIFFKEKNNKGYLETYKKYYWWNDMHFNIEGNKLVAREISKILK